MRFTSWETSRNIGLFRASFSRKRRVSIEIQPWNKVFSHMPISTWVFPKPESYMWIRKMGLTHKTQFRPKLLIELKSPKHFKMPGNSGMVLSLIYTHREKPHLHWIIFRHLLLRWRLKAYFTLGLYTLLPNLIFHTTSHSFSLLHGVTAFSRRSSGCTDTRQLTMQGNRGLSASLLMVEVLAWISSYFTIASHEFQKFKKRQHLAQLC